MIVAANNQTRVYGQNNPAISVAVNGVFNGDDVSADYTNTAGQYSDVGDYPITFNGLTGAKAMDYSTTVTGGSANGGTLTVTPAPLTVTIDNQSKVYGQANPTLTGTVVGVLNGDDVTALYTTTAGQYSDVGGYAITLAGLSGTKAQDYSASVVRRVGHAGRPDGDTGALDGDGRRPVEGVRPAQPHAQGHRRRHPQRRRRHGQLHHHRHPVQRGRVRSAIRSRSRD